MIIMLMVLTLVISGNNAHAAQRDATKSKDSQSIGDSANAIATHGADGSLATSLVLAGSDGATSNGKGNGNGNGHMATTIMSSATLTQTTTTTTTSTSSSARTVTLSTGAIAASGKPGIVSTAATATTAPSPTTSTHSGGSAVALQVPSVAVGSSGLQRNTIEVEEQRSGPIFDKAASKNVTALLGKTAYLNCRVKNIGNKTMLSQVSWVRHRDVHLLTVGRYTYTSDQRFRAIHQPQTEDWILQIKYPQHRDSGIYECQVSTSTHMSHYIHLTVVEPSTEIIGAPDVYIESGSTINLTCVILNSPEPPAYIFWNHNNAIINYDSPRGGVSVVTNKGETTTSFLLIKSAQPSDSGHYQCNPSNAKQKSVTVHVLNGKFPAAMQRAVLAHHRMSPAAYLLVYLSVCSFTAAFVGRYVQLPLPPTAITTITSAAAGRWSSPAAM